MITVLFGVYLVFFIVFNLDGIRRRTAVKDMEDQLKDARKVYRWNLDQSEEEARYWKARYLELMH